jgi:hypothetical protein
MALEVCIVDAQPQTFEQTHSCSMKQPNLQAKLWFGDLLQCLADVGFGEDDGQRVDCMAMFWVPRAPLHSKARLVRWASTLGTLISMGWRVWWKRMNAFIPCR